jgi:hypothetical protein
MVKAAANFLGTEIHAAGVKAVEDFVDRTVLASRSILLDDDVTDRPEFESLFALAKLGVV